MNPGDLATIYNSLKKTDKEDALKLARLIKSIPREELPEVTIPSEKEEDSRDIPDFVRSIKLIIFLINQTLV